MAKRKKQKDLTDIEGFEIENEFEGQEDETFDEGEDQVKSPKDKIFNNAYNTGDVEFEAFGKIKVQDDYNYFDPEFTDNSYESYERKNLQTDLYEIFVKAPFYEKYKKIKSVPKNEMSKIYYYFAEPVKAKNKYTSVEIFTEIANFMNLNYKEMFHALLPLDKQEIIAELDDSFGVLKKRKIKRLF